MSGHQVDTAGFDEPPDCAAYPQQAARKAGPLCREGLDPAAGPGGDIGRLDDQAMDRDALAGQGIGEVVEDSIQAAGTIV
jgi:hypothetical protein